MEVVRHELENTSIVWMNIDIDTCLRWLDTDWDEDFNPRPDALKKHVRSALDAVVYPLLSPESPVANVPIEHFLRDPLHAFEDSRVNMMAKLAYAMFLEYMRPITNWSLYNIGAGEMDKMMKKWPSLVPEALSLYRVAVREDEEPEYLKRLEGNPKYKPYLDYKKNKTGLLFIHQVVKGETQIIK